MGIASDSYWVNTSAIPPGLVVCAMVDAFSLCRNLIFPGDRTRWQTELRSESETYMEAKGSNLNADGIIIL